MSFIVYMNGDNHKEYIANGKVYTVQGSRYVPLTNDKDKARRYKTKYSAQKAVDQDVTNLYEKCYIEEISDKGAL